MERGCYLFFFFLSRFHYNYQYCPSSCYIPISTEMEVLGILKLVSSEIKASFAFYISEKYYQKTMQYIKNRTDDLMSILLAIK